MPNNDLISRAAAINVFMSKPLDYYHSSYIVGELNILPTVDAESARQWISVEDRLPEKNGPYIVFGCSDAMKKFLPDYQAYY